MLSVVLISPDYVESNTPTGLCAAALAHAFAQRDCDVHVVCRSSAARDPNDAHAGSITVHRMDTRRGAPDHAFTTMAVQCVLGLARVGRCDAIECLDTPGCVVGLSALGQAGMLDASIMAVLVDPDRNNTPFSKSACSMGCALVRIGERGPEADKHTIPFPLQEHVWNPPAASGSMFVACDAISESEHDLMIRGFEESKSREQGWSLGLLNEGGHWSILSGAAHASDQSSNRRVVVTIGKAPPIAPVHALWHGEMCLFSQDSAMGADLRTDFGAYMFAQTDHRSLSLAMQRAVGLSEPQYDAHSVSMAQTQLDRHRLDPILDAHERLWANAPDAISTRERTMVWKQLEHHASQICNRSTL